MTQTTPCLDADELLHLAMAAAKHERHEAAIEMLKRAIDIAPNHANAHYFLAAEHAQIGMFDRAIDEMERSVRLDPSLHTAHFQLGLLHLTSGRLVQASAAWYPLDALGESHPLFLFKKGLEAMASDRFAECRQYLTQGMELNRIYPNLNADMQHMLEILPSEAQETANTKQTGHVFLSAYSNDKQSG